MKYTLPTLIFLLFWQTANQATALRLPVFGGHKTVLIDVIMLAKMMQGEAGNQGSLGMVWVADVLKNRAKKSGNTIAKEVENGFHLSKSFKPETFELAKVAILSPPLHEYTYFLNPRTATDRKFVKWAKTRQGKMVGAHWFFGDVKKD